MWTPLASKQQQSNQMKIAKLMFLALIMRAISYKRLYYYYCYYHSMCLYNKAIWWGEEGNDDDNEESNEK